MNIEVWKEHFVVLAGWLLTSKYEYDRKGVIKEQLRKMKSFTKSLLNTFNDPEHEVIAKRFAHRYVSEILKELDRDFQHLKVEHGSIKGKPGPKKFPMELCSEILWAIEICREQKIELDWLMEFLKADGEFVRWQRDKYREVVLTPLSVTSDPLDPTVGIRRLRATCLSNLTEGDKSNEEGLLESIKARPASIAIDNPHYGKPIGGRSNNGQVSVSINENDY